MTAEKKVFDKIFLSKAYEKNLKIQINTGKISNTPELSGVFLSVFWGEMEKSVERFLAEAIVYCRFLC